MKSQTSLIAYIQDLLGEDFNIALFFSIVRKSLIWIFLLILTGCTIVFLYLRYTLPIYEANSSLMMKREKPLKNQLFGGESILEGSFEESYNEINVIKSKYFVQRVISKLSFDISYFKEGRTKFVSSELYTSTPFIVQIPKVNDPLVYDSEIYVELLNDKSFILRYTIDKYEYGEILSYGKHFETPLFEIRVSLAPGVLNSKNDYFGKTYFFRINDIERYAELLLQKIVVEPPYDPTSRNIGIKYLDRNKSKAKDLVNALAKEFIAYDIERQAESADQILNFLNNEIDTLSTEIEAYSDTLKQYRLEKKFLDPEQEMSTLVQSLRGIEQTKQQYMLELKVIDWFNNYIGNLTDLEAISSGLLGGELSNINQYIGNIKNLDQQKEQYLLDVSPDHPNIKMIEDNIIRVKNDMIKDLDIIVIQKNYKLESLNEQYDRYLNRLLILPEERDEYARLKSQYDKMVNYFNMLISKRSDYDLAKAGMVSDYIVLSTASLPQKPIGPNDNYLWGIAVVAGLILGLILIVIRYMLHNTIISVETISKNTKAPVLGIVPTVFADIPTTGIVVTQNPKSIITEAFRALRNNLQFISNTPGPKTIAVTSTISGEGKTFVSINIAAIHSLLDKKVIVVDVDMRRPRLSKIFNTDNTSGMSTILIGRDKPEDCIRKTELKNFDYITSGPIPPNPAELILSERLNELIEFLKTKYDYIIFDTPPLGLVTDGFEIIKNVDYPIYVFRAEYSSKSFISNLDKLINENKVTKLSALLNDVGRGVSGYYYGGYSYKYGYSYGYLYSHKDSGYYAENAQEKKSFLKKMFGKTT